MNRASAVHPIRQAAGGIGIGVARSSTIVH
jgi:hypothetical protein